MKAEAVDEIRGRAEHGESQASIAKRLGFSRATICNVVNAPEQFVEPTTKVCFRCKQEQPIKHFAYNTLQRDGRHVWCRTCVREHKQTPGYRKRNRDWEAKRRAADPTIDERRNTRQRSKSPEYKRANRLKKYGLTIVEFEAILASQGGRCAICRTNDPPPMGGRGLGLGRGWQVDHDHSTERSGKILVRGILCGPCNVGLGAFGDSPNRLVTAAAYLQQTGKK